jgi:Outer membrane protein beta-barrel domain
VRRDHGGRFIFVILPLGAFRAQEEAAMSTATILSRQLPLCLAVVLALGTAGAAQAQDEENVSGPYLGAGYGEFDVELEGLEGVDEVIEDLDTDDSAFKVFFGWRFNPYIALEADYIDLGNPRGNFDATGSSGDYEVELAGFAGYLIGSLPLGIFELSAKVGYYFHDVDLTVDLENIGSGDGDVIESSDNGEAVVYGIGAGVTFIDHINAKIEYELMDIDDFDDANVLWITGAWRF